MGNSPPSIELIPGFDLENLQIENARSTWLEVIAKDDHQVRTVELFLDGEFAALDGSYPFEFGFVPPLLTQSKSTFALQVRATDMAGLSTLSDSIELAIVDTLGPRILFQNPTNEELLFTDTTSAIVKTHHTFSLLVVRNRVV